MKIIKIANNSIYLWLDDERDPKSSFIQKNFGAKGNEIWVKTPEEAIKYLSSGKVKSISFDHDLGEGIGTGYDLAKWIEEKAYFKELKRIEWRIHSANPTGRKNIENAMISAERFWIDEPQSGSTSRI